MMKTRIIWDMWLCLLVNVSDPEDVSSKLLQNISSYLQSACCHIISQKAWYL